MSYFKYIKQDVVADANNSSDTNLDSGNSYTFTGTATSTLGVAGIQVSLKADQDCTIKVQQSPDGDNWDIEDSYYYHILENSSFGLTVQAVNSYVRVIVTTASLTTTTFRLQTALCPIVEAVPRSLDEDGNFKVAIKSIEDEYGFGVENTPMEEMRVVTPHRLVGANLTFGTKDTNFWTETVTGTGQVIAGAGQTELTTGTTANSTATYTTVRSARYVSGSSNRFRGQIQFNNSGETNNSRKWGCWSATDGAYFELDGTTLYVVTLKASTPTRVASTEWNANRVLPTLTSCNVYEIYYTNGAVWFSINGTMKHKVTASATPWCATNSFPVRFSNVNSSGEADEHIIYVRAATIARLGPAETDTIYRNIAGAVTNTVYKFGPGKLHKVVVSSPSGAGTCSIYDNAVPNTTNPIAIINTNKADAVGNMFEYDVPFSNGLSIVTTGTGGNITVIYE